MAAPKQPLSILCFGDSLTEGYSQHGLRFTPYSAAMQTRLEKQLGKEWEIEVHTDGMSGDQVTGGFLTRMEDRCNFSLSPPPPGLAHLLSLQDLNPVLVPFLIYAFLVMIFLCLCCH